MMPDLLGNPYVGPRTFSAEEADRFFGREREARDLLALVVSNRLVLFYAQSGAGKSSLIRTRLLPRLTESEGFFALPIGRVKGDLPRGIDDVDNIFLFNLYLSLVAGDETDPGRFARTDELTLTKFLANLITIDGVNYYYEDVAIGDEEGAAEFEAPPHVLIIDQFEDVITTHRDRWKEREGFFEQLGRAMVADPRLWVVLALREDSVAALDPYGHLVPGRMRSRFYMQRLEKGAALDAVRRPAELAGRPFEPGVAERLVNDLCQIRVHGRQSPTAGQYIEPVQLQVVCYQLWENLKTRPGETITHEDLEHAGDIDTAMADFYEQAITTALRKTAESEWRLRNWFEQELITEGGTRGAVFRGDQRSGEIDTRTADALVEEFILRTENRAGGIWYELIHDRFVQPVLQANQAWREEQQQDAEHLGEKLQTALLEEGKFAQDIIVMIASPSTGTWVSSEDLLLESIRPFLAEHGYDALESKIAQLVGLVSFRSFVLAATTDSISPELKEYYRDAPTSKLDSISPELRKYYLDALTSKLAESTSMPGDDLLLGLAELVRPYSVSSIRAVLGRYVQQSGALELLIELLRPYASGELPRALDRLVNAGVLIKRTVPGRPEYAFANQVVAEKARALFQQRNWRRFRYEDELERTWAAWLARGALATRGQLRFLAEGSALIIPQPAVALLLLRSAVTKDQPIAPWLEALHTEEGRRLLLHVDDPGRAEVVSVTSTARGQAACLLGLQDPELRAFPHYAGNNHSQIARSAVLHPDRAVRQTAALALTAVEPYPEVVLEDALRSIEVSASRRRRQLAELWGTLIDADPEVGMRLQGAAPWERIWVQAWRFQRQVSRDRIYILGLALGGAMGAGLGLGILRAVLATILPIGSFKPAIWFSIYFFWGAILGACLGCGMAVAKSLGLSGFTRRKATSAGRASMPTQRTPANAAVLYGTVFFQAGYLIVCSLNGLPGERLLPTAVGLLVGLGLNLALYRQPQAGLRLGVGRWLLRLGIAVLFFASGQLLSLAIGDFGLVFTWSGSFFSAYLEPTIGSRWPGLMGRFPNWHIVLSVVDAALVGIFLTIGLTAGLVLAARWVARLRKLVESSAD
jgi:hypothetical protein